MTNLPTPELQAAVERSTSVKPRNLDGFDYVWIRHDDLRLILAALEARGKALKEAEAHLAEYLAEIGPIGRGGRSEKLLNTIRTALGGTADV